MEKSRNNSRRLMAIIAVVLMVCLILAMGAVTFAKYISSGTTGDQTATAAKWGFVVTVDASKLLGENYSVQGSDTLATVVTADGVAVKASADSGNLVAPGTTGSVTFTISGEAEVAAKLTLSVSPATGSSIEEIYVSDYYPIKWTLKKGDDVVNTLENKKLSEITSGELATIAAGTSASGTYTLSWEWKLDNSKDAEDTIIGYKVAGKGYDDIKNITIGGKTLGGTGGVVADATAFDAIKTQMSFNIAFSIEQTQTVSE